MNFVRYKGVERPGECEFVPGKIYWADNHLGGNAYDPEAYVIEDECGNRRMVRDASSEFEFLPEVYAVVVEPFEDFEVGQVVVLDDIEDDGNLKVSVKGCGLRDPASVAVIDRTTLYPGMTVMEEQTGLWKRVLRTDEAMWLSVEDKSICSPEQFRFAVSTGGEILAEPILTCIQNAGVESSLTLSNFYTPIRSVVSDCTITDYELADNSGQVKIYPEWRFKAG